MKIRNDFVSNSSSSSFIVIKDTNKEYLDFYGQEIAVPNTEFGQCEFGWSFKKYHSFGDKLNFCALILNNVLSLKDTIDYYEKVLTEDNNLSLYMKDWHKQVIRDAKKLYVRYNDMKNMLMDVCKEKFNLEIQVINLKECNIFAYIDHQSGPFENPSIIEMFDNEDKLLDFLTSNDSYIATGNDNDDAPEGWYE
jgi:hypothetical protein